MPRATPRSSARYKGAVAKRLLALDASGRGFAVAYASGDGRQSGHGAAVSIHGGVAYVLGVAAPGDSGPNGVRVNAIAASMQSASD